MHPRYANETRQSPEMSFSIYRQRCHRGSIRRHLAECVASAAWERRRVREREGGHGEEIPILRMSSSSSAGGTPDDWSWSYSNRRFLVLLHLLSHPFILGVIIKWIQADSSISRSKTSRRIGHQHESLVLLQNNEELKICFISFICLFSFH